jgi:squalene-associated FAD-dependent desaturase
VTQPGAKRLVIVGGGLAGLAAAVAAARQGWSPLVLEKRPYLGGRAFSFVDRETGVEVDNGQHVFLGACTEYIAFLKKIGAWGNVVLQDRLDIPVVRNGRTSRLRWSSRVPEGLGLLPSLLSYRHLSLGDKLRVLYGMTRIRSVRDASVNGPGSLDGEAFEAWLRRNGQNDATIQNLWNLIVLPALNDDISAVSAGAGVMLFRTALMGGRVDAAIGYSRVALSRLAGDASTSYIRAHGGDVRTSTEVARLEISGTGAGVPSDMQAAMPTRLARPLRVDAVTTATGGRIPCQAAVVAVSHHALGALLPPALAARPEFEPASRLESAPIVGVHIWYDRPVLDDTFVAVLDSPVQWVFNVDAMHDRLGPAADHRDRVAGPGDSTGAQQHVVISLSGAWTWSQMTRDELRDVFLPEMARLFPRAAAANVVRFLSVKQIQATFRCTPGTAKLRLGQRTPVSNLFLAGDWTATGWPSTMESAVRSGNLAASGLGPAPAEEIGAGAGAAIAMAGRS